MKHSFWITICLVLSGNLPTLAQNYNSSYGNSKVINQSQTGLARTSATYIGTGTLSKTAQGLNSQSNSTNPGLPPVKMGANIGTPGDNQYRQKSPTSTPRAGQRNNQQYYAGGINNRAGQYRNQNKRQYKYVPNNGVATYAEHGYGDGTGARHF